MFSSQPTNLDVKVQNRSLIRRMTQIMMAIGISWIAFGIISEARAKPQAGPASYSTMAPIEQYLMADQALEIAQARAAAPPSISADADVLILDRKGYQTAVKGKNGFVCLVQRAWFSGPTDDEFWNPKERAPICFNPQGARSVLPAYIERTKWALSGMTREEIITHTKTEIAAHAFPVPEIGTIAYMLARDAYHSDRVHGPWHPHLMFFLPPMNVADWGANLPVSPVMGASGGIEPFTVFFVPLADWSDGTPDASPPRMHIQG